MTAHAIQLSGGGLRGINEVTPLEALTGVGEGAKLFPTYELPWDTLSFTGGSIGALLAAAASDGPKGVAKVRPMFARLRSMKDIFSIPIDLKDGVFKDGLVSMKKARELLKAEGIGKVCAFPAWVAITIAATGKTELVKLNDLTWSERLDAVFVSASQSPIMEIVKWRGEVAYDCGLEGAVCPDIPPEVLERMKAAPETSSWHELWAAPPHAAARSAPRTEAEVDDLFGLFGVQLDRQVARVCVQDLERFNGYARLGLKGFRYSPRNMAEAGPTFGPLNPEKFRPRIHNGLTVVGKEAARTRIKVG